MGSESFASSSACHIPLSGTVNWGNCYPSITPAISFPSAVGITYGYSTQVVETKPLMTMIETFDQFLFQYAVPGVEAEDIQSYIRNEELMVEFEDKDYLFPELIQDFSIDILDTYSTEDISLTVCNGILQVAIKKNTPDKQLTVK